RQPDEPPEPARRSNGSGAPVRALEHVAERVVESRVESERVPPARFPRRRALLGHVALAAYPPLHRGASYREARMRRSTGTIAGLSLALAAGGLLDAQAATPAGTNLAAEVLAPAWSASSDFELNESLAAPWVTQQETQALQEPKRWSDFLPLMKEEAIKR